MRPPGRGWGLGAEEACSIYWWWTIWPQASACFVHRQSGEEERSSFSWKRIKDSGPQHLPRNPLEVPKVLPGVLRGQHYFHNNTETRYVFSTDTCICCSFSTNQGPSIQLHEPSLYSSHPALHDKICQFHLGVFLMKQ